jgi:hypothetical protein
VFENKVLRRVFGLKRDEVTGGWEKLHNKKLHNLLFTRYEQNYQVGEDEVGGGHVARMGEKRNAFT